MTRMVYCAKLGKEAEGLDQPPYPGELGQKIYESISKEAWQQWMQHQTMLINENRLSVIDPKHRAFLEEQMQKFLFEDSAQTPEGYTPPQ
jgi:Fe-S cluster biosynthesis and repair protein YggX